MTKRDVTPDDSQQRFLAQHNAAMLEQCCNHSKQCRNNVATLCCARNRRCETSETSSLWNITLKAWLPMLASTFYKREIDVAVTSSENAL